MILSQYIEKLVVKRKDKRDYMMMGALPLTATLAIFAILKILPLNMAALGAVLVFVIGYLMYFAIKMIYLEYEYAITLGDLDIDSIRGQKKRVRIYSGSLSQIDEMGPYYSDDDIKHLTNAVNRIDAVSALTDKDIYFFVGSYKGQRTLVLFQPSHEMLMACKKYMGRKLTLRPGDEIMISSLGDDQE